MAGRPGLCSCLEPRGLCSGGQPERPLSVIACRPAMSVDRLLTHTRQTQCRTRRGRAGPFAPSSRFIAQKGGGSFLIGSRFEWNGLGSTPDRTRLWHHGSGEAGPINPYGPHWPGLAWLGDMTGSHEDMALQVRYLADDLLCSWSRLMLFDCRGPAHTLWHTPNTVVCPSTDPPGPRGRAPRFYQILLPKFFTKIFLPKFFYQNFLPFTRIIFYLFPNLVKGKIF